MFGAGFKKRHPFRPLRWPVLSVSPQYMLRIEANIYVVEGDECRFLIEVAEELEYLV
jgi:hypothetical protein